MELSFANIFEKLAAPNKPVTQFTNSNYRANTPCHSLAPGHTVHFMYTLYQFLLVHNMTGKITIQFYLI